MKTQWGETHATGVRKEQGKRAIEKKRVQANAPVARASMAPMSKWFVGSSKITTWGFWYVKHAKLTRLF